MTPANVRPPVVPIAKGQMLVWCSSPAPCSLVCEGCSSITTAHRRRAEQAPGNEDCVRRQPFYSTLVCVGRASLAAVPSRRSHGFLHCALDDAIRVRGRCSFARAADDPRAVLHYPPPLARDRSSRPRRPTFGGEMVSRHAMVASAQGWATNTQP